MGRNIAKWFNDRTNYFRNRQMYNR
jgi:hypothetical protein